MTAMPASASAPARASSTPMPSSPSVTKRVMAQLPSARFAALLILLGTTTSSPLAAETLEYRVLVGGTDTGALVVEREGRRIEIDLDYKQNGRGPTITEVLELDESGFPASWQIEGSTTFGNAVDEYYRYADGRASWRDATGSGEDELDENRFYVDQNGSFYSLALLARALLADDDGVIDVLPGGSVRIESRGTLTLGGADGPKTVTTYEIFGLSTTPANVTLDEDGEFFATASPRFATTASKNGICSSTTAWTTSRSPGPSSSTGAPPAE